MNNCLHENGYQIYKNAIEISQDVLNELKNQGNNSKVIFNHNLRKVNDKKRKQCPINKNKKIIKNFVSNINDIVKQVNPKLSMKNTVIIKSLKGCQEQAPHTDYLLNEELISCSDEDIPLALIVALQDNTTLLTWNKSIKLNEKQNKKRKRNEENIFPIPKTTAILNKGDVLIFRADFIHAGSSYQEENIRIHSFLDNPKIKRNKNVTNIIVNNNLIEF